MKTVVRNMSDTQRRCKCCGKVCALKVVEVYTKGVARHQVRYETHSESNSDAEHNNVFNRIKVFHEKAHPLRAEVKKYFKENEEPYWRLYDIDMTSVMPCACEKRTQLQPTLYVQSKLNNAHDEIVLSPRHIDEVTAENLISQIRLEVNERFYQNGWIGEDWPTVIGNIKNIVSASIDAGKFKEDN